MQSTQHSHIHKSGYRGGATWITENEAKRKAIKEQKDRNSPISVQKHGLNRAVSMEYASAAPTVQDLEALPKEPHPHYFKQKTARDRLRTRLHARYVGEDAVDMATTHDPTLSLRPDHDRLNDGFLKPIDRQAEAIMGVYQSDLDDQWGN
jgi:hypothetical protein